MLDDVERRAFLIQPARKYPFPDSAGLLDVKLDEGPGQPFILPRRGRVARPQAHHRVAETDRLPRLQRDVADDAVALVEQAEDGDALAHRGDAGHRLDRARNVDRHRIGAVDRLLGLGREPVAPRAQRQQRQQDKAGRADYSGFHAW